MKKLRTPKSVIVKLGLAGVAGMLLLSSCTKKAESVPAPAAAYLTFVDASPDATSILFALNGQQVNSQPLAFDNIIPYFAVSPGTLQGLCYSTGTNTTLAIDTITTIANNGYSLFLTNKAASQYQLVLLTDSISKPASGSASIRFVNLSANAGAVDFAIKGGSVLVSNVNFKKYSSFQPITSGNYNFEIRQTGTSNVLATVASSSLQAGAVYTVWLQGFSGSSNPTAQLGGQIMENASY